MPVQSGDTVRVHYRGSLADGTQFDSSEGRDPIAFTVGESQVIPGFENGVVGLEVGESVTVSIEPDQAYGPRQEELFQTFPKADFAEEPCVGGSVSAVSPQGEHLTGRVVKIEDDAVTLDFNHPLAGETLTFEIEVVGIEPGRGGILRP